MKLNYKRTIFVGFAFFLICSFWQAYDNTIPLILTNKFGMSQAWSGVIMALDNVLALFMLPLFGAISDRHRGKRGRRTPFIVVGTLIAAVMLIALSFVDNAQLRHLSDVSAIEQLENYKMFMTHYVDHNCSITVHVRDAEWDAVEQWVWDNWDDVVALSFLSYDDNFYELLPYEAITEEEYNRRKAAMKPFNPSLISRYEHEESELDIGESECAGGVCPVR